MRSQNKKTHFGFKEIEESEKAHMVRGVFSSVASKYDVMNDVMSFGIHRIWKNSMMDWLSPQPNQKLLDVAGGTGDISFRFLKRAPSAHATVFDMTQSMLDEGQLRSEAEKIENHIKYIFICIHFIRIKFLGVYICKGAAFPLLKLIRIKILNLGKYYDISE